MVRPFSPFTAFTICEERDVTEALDAARGEYARLDELVEGVTWRLARRPDAGARIETGERTYYVMRTPDRGPQFPVLVLLYTIDGSTITLEAVKVLGPQAGV